MYIIGTAGHVDHGKTALIKALTGTDTDRLPEEKKRGLTIDLGFASFQDPAGYFIGIIDVPGHERFIRNMVAGAWSLDCALLLIAADDGWMDQTEDHARVLLGIGIPNILLVISKADSVAEEQLELVTLDAQTRGYELFNKDLPAIAVSAHTGQGLETLKTLITETLRRKETLRRMPHCVYVDRVFSMPGAGTVITGSYTGNRSNCKPEMLTKQSEITLFPAKTSGKIRSIQAYNKDLTEVRPNSRVALNLQGVKKESLNRGTCITPNPELFTSFTEALVTIQGFPLHGSQQSAGGASLVTPTVTASGTVSGQASLSGAYGATQLPVKNHSEVEIAFGTFHEKARIHLIGPGAQNNNNVLLARIVLESEGAAAWGMPCICIRHGGSTILGYGKLIYLHNTRPKDRRLLAAYAKKGIDFGALQYSKTMDLLMQGYVQAETSSKLDTSKPGPKDIQTLAPIDTGLDLDIIQVGWWYLLKPMYQDIEKTIIQKALKSGGTTVNELCSTSKLPRNLIQGIIENLLTHNKISHQDNIITGPLDPKNKDTSTLSKQESTILELAATGGFAGLDIDKQKIPNIRQIIRSLARDGYLVVIENQFAYPKETYRNMCTIILKGLHPGDRFTIGDAKHKVNLSRKFIIPILNKMETDGFVKRDENERVVLKTCLD